MNSFGRLFRISAFGESHGECVGILIDGCPAGIPLSAEDFEPDLARRRSGALGTTPRKEADAPLLRAGVFQGTTTGAPLLIEFRNADTDSSAYESIKYTPRPGHADFVAHKKFHGFNDYRGGGHFSGRLTTGLVATGVVAKKILSPMTIAAQLVEAGGQVDIQQAVQSALDAGDSIGGIVECRVRNVPIGLGEPFFDSLESLLSHALFSIPAIKGVEFGAGFQAARMRGSKHNDAILDTGGTTKSNNAGGINGGISNGNDIVFRVAVKPTSSVKVAGETVDLRTGDATILQVQGRHDACIALRVPPVVEAMTAVVLADCALLQRAYGSS